MANQFGGSSLPNQSSDKKGKTVWNSDLHSIFVELCYDQMLKGNKKGTFLTKEGWKNVIANFQRRTEKKYDKKQMKNHWDSTKSEWKIWYKLKKEETGLGWDYEKDTVVASDDWWTNYLQVNPDAAKFRQKGIEHSDYLTALFKDGIATGNLAWTPSQGILPKDNVGPCRSDQDTQDTQEEMDANTILHNEQEQETDGVRDNDSTCRRRSGDFNPLPPPEKRRKVTQTTNASNVLERICNAVESRAANSSTRGDSYTIKECIDLLNQMIEVPKGGDIYMFACDTLFLQKELRELFIALGEHDLRLTWLQNRHMSSKTPQQ